MINQQIYQKIRHLIEQPSDIREHLLTLMFYAMDCDHITEMGVRDVVSTWAFLAAEPTKLVSIDINYTANIEPAIEIAKNNGTELQFLTQDTIQPGFEIEPTDLLFIDTLHTYGQLKNELAMHGNKAKKYLAFHDTTTYAYENDRHNSNPNEVRNNWTPIGLRPAITEFVEKNPHWVMCNWYENNNGLTILKRI